MPLIVTRTPRTRQPQYPARHRSDWCVIWNFGARDVPLSPAPDGGYVPGSEGIAARFTATSTGSASTGIAPGVTTELTAVMIVHPTAPQYSLNFLFGEAAPALGPYNWGFYERGNGALAFFVHNGSSGVYADDPTRVWGNINRPLCCVATYDGASIRLYVDGELMGSAAHSGSIQRDASAVLSWARWQSVNGSPTCLLYGAAVAPRAFGAAEIRGRLGSVQAAWSALFATPIERRIWVPSASSAVPSITAVYADSVTASSVVPRVTLDFA